MFSVGRAKVDQLLDDTQSFDSGSFLTMQQWCTYQAHFQHFWTVTRLVLRRVVVFSSMPVIHHWRTSAYASSGSRSAHPLSFIVSLIGPSPLDCRYWSFTWFSLHCSQTVAQPCSGDWCSLPLLLCWLLDNAVNVDPSMPAWVSLSIWLDGSSACLMCSYFTHNWNQPLTI